MDLTKLDKNFTVDSTFDYSEIDWYDIEEAPFTIYGRCLNGDNPFARIPYETAINASENVAILSRRSAGVRARFATNSPFLALKVKLDHCEKFSHMTLLGTAGFDLYCDDNEKSAFVRVFGIPTDRDVSQGYDSKWDLYPASRHAEGEYLHWTLNFPLYSEVGKVYVGVKKGSKLGEGKKYPQEKPIVFYGSSITQGACASRPGNAYESMICRDIDYDHYNFGFSGSCKGEKVLAEYFGNIPTEVFVCDYDHNTPSIEHLKETYYPFYEEYRKKQPNTPYIMVTRIDCLWNSLGFLDKCREVIYEAYQKAKANGDENVYFVDGSKIMEGPNRDACLVDGGHPTDLGMSRMAEVIGTKIKEVLKKESK